MIQIEEIRAGHLPHGGDLFIQIEAGTNPIFRSGCLLGSHGDFCEWNEVFTLNLRRFDGDVLIKIMDQDMLSHDEIGSIEMDSYDFIKLARRNTQGQIYRFDLKLPGKSYAQRKKGLRGARGVQPYIAFRMSEVTYDVEQVRGNAGLKESERLITQPGLTHYRIDPADNQVDFDNPEVIDRNGTATKPQPFTMMSLFSSFSAPRTSYTQLTPQQASPQ